MNKETIIQSIIYMLEQMTENEVRDFYHKNFIKKEKFKILKIFEECMYCKKKIDKKEERLICEDCEKKY